MKRIIQVGVGGMGSGWTDRVAESPRWQAAAYVDTNKANLIAAAERHGLSKRRCFKDFRTAIQSVEADALLDVTPQQCRREVCVEALKSGLHVLSEKPLADTLRNAKAIVQCARKNGRTYMVAQNYRYQPVMQTVKRLIDRGRLGEIGYVGVSFHKGPHFDGYREEMPYPLILDMAIHHFDLLRYLLDDDVDEVSATSIDTPWNWNQGDASVMAQLRLKGGAMANYFGSWVSTGWETGWNADWRIEGAKGVALIERDTVYFSGNAGRRRKVPLVKMPLIHQDCLLDTFAKALDSGEEPETGGDRNLNSLATTHAVVLAAKQKRRVQVRELLK